MNFNLIIKKYIYLKNLFIKFIKSNIYHGECKNKKKMLKHGIKKNTWLKYYQYRKLRW